MPQTLRGQKGQQIWQIPHQAAALQRVVCCFMEQTLPACMLGRAASRACDRGMTPDNSNTKLSAAAASSCNCCKPHVQASQFLSFLQCAEWRQDKCKYLHCNLRASLVE